MLFAIKKFFELFFMHALPCYIAFRWANKINKNPWKWAVICFLSSYFGLVVFGLLLNRKGLPTYEEYAAANPAYAGRNGVTCNQCGSRSIRLWRHQPFFRVQQWHVCNHCGTTLYRSL